MAEAIARDDGRSQSLGKVDSLRRNWQKKARSTSVFIVVLWKRWASFITTVYSKLRPSLIADEGRSSASHLRGE